MGKNFFGVEEGIRHFGVNPTRQQLTVLSEIPFSEAVLEESKNTHVLVAVFPLSILEIRERVDPKLFGNQSWYAEEPFAREHGKLSWQLVRKTSADWNDDRVPTSQAIFFDLIEELLEEDDEILTAQVMVYTIVGHYLSTGECLFEDISANTSSEDSDGDPVDVIFSKHTSLSGLLLIASTHKEGRLTVKSW